VEAIAPDEPVLRQLMGLRRRDASTLHQLLTGGKMVDYTDHAVTKNVEVSSIRFYKCKTTKYGNK